MPIEIKELHIKAVVGSRDQKESRGDVKQEDLLKLKKDIIREMTEKMSRMLKQKNER